MKKPLSYLTLLILCFSSTLIAMEGQDPYAESPSQKRSLDHLETTEQPQEKRQRLNPDPLSPQSLTQASTTAIIAGAQEETYHPQGVHVKGEAHEIGGIYGQFRLFSDTGEPQDLLNQLKELKNLADRENARAQYAVGCLYVNEIGIPRNYDIGVRYLERAASRNYPCARYELGRLAHQGGSKDFRKACGHYSKAAPYVPTAYYDICCIAKEILGRYESEENARTSQDAFDLSLTSYVCCNFLICLTFPGLDKQQKSEMLLLSGDLFYHELGRPGDLLKAYEAYYYDLSLGNADANKKLQEVNECPESLEKVREEMPKECWQQHIFSFLNLRELGPIREVCKEFRRLTWKENTELPARSFGLPINYILLFYPYLTSLDCLNGYEDITDDMIVQLTNLKRLNIKKCKLITDKGIAQLTNLTELALHENDTITDQGLSHLTGLTVLNLDFNKLITDQGLSHLANLTKLTLSYNDIITDQGLSHLTNLTKLTLHDNDIITDVGLCHLINLTKLTLSYNDIITDKGLSHLTGLTELSLDSNKLITDVGLSHLTGLTELSLDSNKLITDVGLCHLTGLTELGLDSNKLITDVGLCHLTNLTELDLWENNIITDVGLCHLTNLTKLTIGHNDIITDVGLCHLTNLTELDLWENNVITDVGLCPLTNLTVLNLHCNKLITDVGLCPLTNLTVLNLHCNKLITDVGLCPLTNLTKLTISYNDIITDVGLCPLTNLTELDLWENNVITDNVLSKLAKLKHYPPS